MVAKGLIILLCVLVAISDGARKPKCRYTPNRCPKIYKPVCGSDGITYVNECSLCAAIEATKTQVLIQKEGPC